jgi:hypothetical protein
MQVEIKLEFNHPVMKQLYQLDSLGFYAYTAKGIPFKFY